MPLVPEGSYASPPFARYRKRGRAGAQAGYDFEKEVDDAFWRLRSQGTPLFHLKLADTHAWDKFAEKVQFSGRGSPERYTAPKVPADFLVCYKSICAMLELKRTSNEKGFDFMDPDRILPHQISFAQDLELEGKGRYLFLIQEAATETVYILSLSDIVTLQRTQIEITERCGAHYMEWQAINAWGWRMRKKRFDHWGEMWDVESLLMVISDLYV